MQRDTVQDGPASGRRERTKQRTRARIYEAAIALFIEKGYDKTTIDDIIGRADVGRGTFFNHFQRKEDLITEWADVRRCLMTDRLKVSVGLEGTDTATLLHLCVAILAQVNEEQHEQASTMLTAWVKTGSPLWEAPYTAAVFADILRDGQQRGDIDPGCEADLIGNVLRDLYLGALFRWVRNNSPRGELGPELRRIVSALLSGISRETERSSPLAGAANPPGAARSR
ncbi:TetR/AcrR family transcriptional regulator [Nocardia fluminea]|uniref:TetR/AcrR family transcriptional regulator n=1 Tax=Nocardia fluminea TaxID=134984 RepID=UPI0033CA8F0E